jgi:hypothetical protein
MENNSKNSPELKTIICLKEKPILADDSFKDIVISSLKFIAQSNRAMVYGFVIMNNRLQILWQMMGNSKTEEVQRDFLKFTAQQILRKLRREENPMLTELLVEARDRKYQVWKRNSRSVLIDDKELAQEKLQDMHNNPVKDGVCHNPAEYKYSSAGFYETNSRAWDFLMPWSQS